MTLRCKPFRAAFNGTQAAHSPYVKDLKWLIEQRDAADIHLNEKTSVKRVAGGKGDAARS